jgi:hypothetical protein
MSDVDAAAAAIMADSKKLAKEKGWLLASALFFMFGHTPKSAGEKRLDRIIELHRRQLISLLTEKRVARYQREVDSMPLPDYLLVEDVEEMEKHT